MNYNMNKFCTSFEESKKLIELGIDVNTADMWWAERYEGVVTENGQYVVAEFPYYYLSLTKPSDTNYSQDTIKDIPAWSLPALMELMNCNCYNISLNCHGAEWNIKFDDSEKYKDFTKDYPLDAAFEMVCWLLENRIL